MLTSTPLFSQPLKTLSPIPHFFCTIYCDLFFLTYKADSTISLLGKSNTLSLIAYALNVHISYFFEEDSEAENGPSIIRKNERKEIIGDYTHLGYSYQAVIKKRANGAIKLLIITLPDNMDPEKIPYNYHDGEEMIYVLKGKMSFYYGDEKYIVEEGDCLHFNSTVPHKVVAVDENQKVKILSVLSL